MAARNANTSPAFAGRCLLPIWALFLPALAFAAGPTKTEYKELAAEDLTCELILTEHLKDLSLTDHQGNPVMYRSSGSSMLLPPGRYSIDEIHFKDGFSVALCSGESGEQITLTPGKTRRLDIGTTLTPNVAVTRVGRVLKLDLQLLDGNGRKHRGIGGMRQAYPPRFAIYQGDRQIGSGAFEYG